jgi:hypothetical protein
MSWWHFMAYKIKKWVYDIETLLIFKLAQTRIQQYCYSIFLFPKSSTKSTQQSETGPGMKNQEPALKSRMPKT